MALITVKTHPPIPHPIHFTPTYLPQRNKSASASKKKCVGIFTAVLIHEPQSGNYPHASQHINTQRDCAGVI